MEMSVWLLALAFLLGLVAGSFLNTVAHRLPLMLAARWQRQALEALGEKALSAQKQALSAHERALSAQKQALSVHERALSSKEQTPSAAQQSAGQQGAQGVNLLWPPSSCPGCGQRIKAWQLVPLLGYLLLRGRCSHCAMRISPRYPLVEAATGMATLAVAAALGPTPAGLLACLLTWALLALALIDQEQGILPDDITLPMLWLGLAVNLFGVFASLEDALIGAMAGYLCLWCLYWGYLLATGKQGMGHGDFKLLAMLGAWLGWQSLLPILLVSSLTGLGSGLWRLARGARRDQPFPFGPYLALAAWLWLLLK